MRQSTTESLITPREIKLMVNIIASQVNALPGRFKTPESFAILASEVAYQVGRQTMPEGYLDHQHDAYHGFVQLMQARQFLLKRFKPGDSIDLGLGGLALEGGAGIGKTHFMEKLAAEYEAKGVPITHIPAAMPYAEKQRLLIETAEKGGIVIAHEWNTCLWPNKILNNLMMGKNATGEKSVETPGFMFLTTQNPPSYDGRLEEDPAIRRRMMKLTVDWPVYKEAPLQSPKRLSVFSHPQLPEAKAPTTPKEYPSPK